MPLSRIPEIRELAAKLTEHARYLPQPAKTPAGDQQADYAHLFSLIAGELERLEDLRPARKAELLKLREAPTSGSYRPDYHADEEDTRG